MTAAGLTGTDASAQNPPRPGKKLLVLDLDYTLLDAKAYSDTSVHALGESAPFRRAAGASS